MTAAEDDADALARCQRGDLTGLDELVARHQANAIRIAYLLTQDRSAAEDIAQESFLRMYRACQQFRTGAAFAPWFNQIVLNTARQSARAARRRRERSLDALQQTTPSLFPSAVADDPALRAELSERQAATLDLLALLTDKQREALVLRYYCGASGSEIARTLGIPAGTARWRLHAALRAFERLARRRSPWLIEAERPATSLIIQTERPATSVIVQTEPHAEPGGQV